jgi:hypothetical protein
VTSTIGIIAVAGSCFKRSHTVKQDQVWRRGNRVHQRRVAVEHGVGAHAFGADHAGQQAQHVRIVVDDEHPEITGAHS